MTGRWSGYVLAGAGPVSTAGAQFCLALFMLAHLPTEAFGRLSFLLVVSQFALGLWSALFTSPLLVAMARAHDGEAGEEPRAIAAASTLGVGLAGLAMAGLAWLSGLALAASLLFAAFAALMLARQFGRAWALAQGRPLVPLASDLAYAGLLLAGLAGLLLRQTATTEAVLALLCLAAAAGLAAVVLAGVVLAGVVLGGAPFALRMAQLPAYRAVWRRDARWALLGVVATEATVNSHSYIVTALYGPAGFAPIAAVALLIRPVTVAINSLVEFERARCAALFARGDLAGMAALRRHVRHGLLAVWCLTALAAGALAWTPPGEALMARFGAARVGLIAALWLGVALARVVHAAEGVMLLAAGRFRQLAWIGVCTGAVSVAGVIVLTVSFGPVLSLGGVLLGEACFAAVLWRGAGRLLASAEKMRNNP